MKPHPWRNTSHSRQLILQSVDLPMMTCIVDSMLQGHLSHSLNMLRDIAAHVVRLDLHTDLLRHCQLSLKKGLGDPAYVGQAQEDHIEHVHHHQGNQGPPQPSTRRFTWLIAHSSCLSCLGTHDNEGDLLRHTAGVAEGLRRRGSTVGLVLLLRRNEVLVFRQLQNAALQHLDKALA